MQQDGKTSRKSPVDIPLGVTGYKFLEGFPTTILELSFHEDSRAMMVKPLESAIRLNQQVVHPGEKACLGNQQNKFEVGGMKWILEWAIKDFDSAVKFSKARDQEMKKAGIGKPLTSCVAVPVPGDKVIPALFRGQQYLPNVEFGKGYKGSHPRDGRAVMTKVLRIERTAEYRLFEKELDAIQAFRGLTGVFEIIGIWGFRKVEEFTDVDFMEVTIVTPLAESWGNFAWDGLEWSAKLKVFKDVAGAIQALHTAGWLHRNVTESNLLILQNPLRGVVTGFGKACAGLTSDDSRIAATEELPPRQYNFVDSTTGNRTMAYSTDLDVFMTARAAIKSFFRRGLGANPDFRSSQLHAFNLQQLTNLNVGP